MQLKPQQVLNANYTGHLGTASKFSLSAFREEILVQIMTNLMRSILPTGTGLPLPQGISTSKNFEGNVNLCLISRLFWTIRLPMIYTRMIITYQIQMTLQVLR